MKWRKIDMTIEKNLRIVMKNKNIFHEIRNGKCATYLSSREFHRCVEDARCLTQKGAKKTRVITSRMFFSAPGQGNCIILERDADKMLQLL